MKLIAGLGNPGKEYDNTPHNVGFAAIDRLAAEYDCKLKKSLRFKAQIGDCRIGPEKVWLVKPATYMNLSGRAIAAIVRYRKIELEELAVIVDDADLPLGQVRIRKKGGSGGHNGLKSVSECLGSDAYTRVRLGVGRREHRDLVSHVLSRFAQEDRGDVENMLSRTVQACECLIGSGVDEAMNRFNTKS